MLVATYLERSKISVEGLKFGKIDVRFATENVAKQHSTALLINDQCFLIATYLGLRVAEIKTVDRFPEMNTGWIVTEVPPQF